MHSSNNDGDGAAHHVRVGKSGRVVMPASVRARHNIRVGDTLVVRSNGRGVELLTYDEVVRAAQDLFCALAPADRILSEELIAERRREAEAE